MSASASSPRFCRTSNFNTVILTSLLSIALPLSAGTTKLQITPTTTLTAETGNNTSAADSVGTATRGYAASGNMSKLPIRSLTYPGATTKIYAALMGWFGKASHLSVGYQSNDPVQVKKQVEDMQSRGIEGAIIAWYGAGTGMENQTAQQLRSQAEAHPGFTFAIMVDQGTIQWNSNGLSATDALIYHLNYVAQTYYPSPAYMRMNGRPVVFDFGLEAWPIDWARVVASVQGNPVFIFRNPVGFTHAFSGGAYSWGPAGGLAYTDYFDKIAATFPTMPVYGDASKGFNDALASWTQNRVVDQQCGQTWLNTLSETGKFYSSTKQLPYLQVATWNDYEEGTSIESGIDNCVSVSASMSGTAVQWWLTGAGLENTIDHYSVFISTDGQNLMSLSDVPVSTHALDLSQYGLAPGSYSLFVKAVAKASLKNQMSSAVSYVVQNVAPTAVLSVTPSSGIAPVTVSASTAGSSDVDGTVTSSQIDFGDGTLVIGSAATHVYRSPGTYTVTATVTDNLGATSTATRGISSAAPSVTISQPANGITVNSPVRVVASAASGLPTTGMWVYVDNVGVYSVFTGSVDTSLKIAAGKHTIQVKAWDSNGNITMSSVVITVPIGTGLIRPKRSSRDTTTPTTTTAAASTATTQSADITAATRSSRSMRLQVNPQP